MDDIAEAHFRQARTRKIHAVRGMLQANSLRSEHANFASNSPYNGVMHAHRGKLGGVVFPKYVLQSISARQTEQ